MSDFIRNPATEAVIKDVATPETNALINSLIIIWRFSGTNAINAPTIIATAVGFEKLLSTNVAIAAARGCFQKHSYKKPLSPLKDQKLTEMASFCNNSINF